MLGSPPRVRGKGKEVQKVIVTAVDHPRVCGEKKAYKDGKEEGEGSPPRVRGKVRQFLHYFADSGITPAYAGKSPRR